MPIKRKIGPRTKAGKFRSKKKLKIVKSLNKVEKNQVNKIILSKAETKYFYGQPFVHDQKLKWQSTTDAYQEIQVRGFTVGPGGLAINNRTYGYSVSNTPQTITPLHMARTFDTTQLDNRYLSQIPDGKQVTPSMCRTTWRLHRFNVDTENTSSRLAAAPILVRFIRVKPKSLKFGDVICDPELDLFQNTFGVAIGVNSGPTTYTRNFGLLEMMTSKINSRKYTVIQDTQFKLEAPLIGTQLNTDLIETMSNTNYQKVIECNHKQPAKLNYSGVYVTADDCEPITEQSGEMIFIHACKAGSSTTSVNLDEFLKIDVRPVSTFKDM